jgi:FlaA1/EpsC-like NDP-sugar epimerase
MWQQWRNPHFYVMLAGDAALFALAHVAAYLCRFDFELSLADLQNIRNVLPYLVAFKLAVFWSFGLYQGMWRYTSIGDLRRLSKAAAVSMLAVIVALLYGRGFAGFSRAVFLLDGVFTFLLAGGFRLGIRCYFYSLKIQENKGPWYLPWLKQAASKRQRRTLIIGAGDPGEKMLREILDSPHLPYKVVGFLDDDPKKQGRALHGVRVLGKVADLSEVVAHHDIEEVLVATPAASGAQMRAIVKACRECGVHYKTIPGMGEILDGRVSIKTLREVNYEDLLGRPPVRLDTADIQDYLAGRVVMVTGGGGSIGSELCRQVVSFQPQALIVVDKSEENLFNMQMKLHHELQFLAYQNILGRVQDRRLMEEIFREYQPKVIFHAAAYKHVPMLEKQPWEAVYNNILGSQVAMEMAVKYQASHFVLVSTDKAVRPASVMGASKRVSELLLQSFRGGGPRFVAVRFGNVVGSSGSVIPLFRRQIEKGGPVTVTHPEVTRYFMTIPEAAQLILQAGGIGEDGGIFVLKMGTPVKIFDMAKDLIQLSGKEAGKDIDIVFTGLREGEKLYEELLTDGEDIVATKHEKILLLRPQNHWNGLRSPKEFRNWLHGGLEELYRITTQLDYYQIKLQLSQIVPDYTPQETESILTVPTKDARRKQAAARRAAPPPLSSRWLTKVPA